MRLFTHYNYGMILVIDKEELTHNIPFSGIIAKITTKGKGRYQW